MNRVIKQIFLSLTLILNILLADTLNLTLDEKEYLKNKKTIKMCTDPDWMPFEKIENGKHIGLASDYMKIIENAIGIPIVLIKTNSWHESISKAKNRKCDIFSMVPIIKERKKYMDFTSPFLDIPMVITTKIDKQFIDNIEQILDKKIGVAKSYSIATILKEKYQNINIIDVESIDDGLVRVESGKIFAFVDNLATINYKIQTNFMKTLKVSGRLDTRLKYRVATRNDEPILRVIFEKAIISIDADTKEKIFRKWINTTEESITINYSLIWKILVGIFIIWFFVTYRHILLRKQNQKLEDSINVFEALLDSALEGIVIFDNEHNCTEVNKEALKLYGADHKSEMIGLNILQFASKNSIAIIKKNLLTQNKETYEAYFVRKNGEEFPALVRGKSIILNGQTVRVSAILDMTNIKNKEKLLMKATQKAQEANKLKSQFLANMSHEIRTPMNGIIGMSHLVLRTDLNDKQKDFIKKIDSNAKSLLRIINDILDFSKVEAGKLTIEKVNFNLLTTIENIIELLKYKAQEKNLKLIVNYSNKLGKVFYGDSLRIGQIITNLLGNAIKFTNDGEVRISIYKIDNNRVRFEVADSGIGLTKEYQRKLFDSFTQADGTIARKYGGTGLGLSISKQLVKLMHGKIWVKSQINIGSRFIFEIELQQIEDIDSVHLVDYPKNYNMENDLQNKADKNMKLIAENRVELFSNLKEALISKRAGDREVQTR